VSDAPASTNPPKSKDFATWPPTTGAQLPPDITAHPGAKELRCSPHLRPATTEYADIPDSFALGGGSHTSIPSARGKLSRPLSLRNKRNTVDALPRRKSSKRKKEDQIREEEIRAMSAAPPQKERYPSYGSSMLRQDSKKVKNGLNRRFQRPTSDISIPTAESIHSSMSGTSEPTAFRISALAVFTPRPTIRYTITPHTISNNPPSSGPSRNNSGRGKKVQITQEIIKESRYIDALADDLNASALRELMERDQRRRERKKESDMERAKRKLQRKADKERREEERRAREAAAADEADVGLGIEQQPQEPVAETQQPEAGPQQEEPEELKHEGTFYDDREEEQPQPAAPKPPAKDAPVESPRSETAPESPFEEPVVSTAQAVRYSHASLSPPSSPVEPTNTQSSISQVVEYPPAPSTAATYSERASESDRRGSETSTRRMSTLATFFRRGSKRFTSKRFRQQQQSPSEQSFSNTSRESMSRQPLPAHLVATMETPQPRALRQGVPHRTMSKFREELPEMPTPPDSRVQSPEAGTEPIPIPRSNYPPTRLQVETQSPLTEESDGQNHSGSPVSRSGRDSAPVSQSLASVDSEGSWLSGRPMKRNSNFRSSLGSTTMARQQESANASYEELGMTDDEYFRRLTPSPDHKRRSANSAEILGRRASSIAVLEENEIPSSPATERAAEGEEEEITHGSVERKPRFIQRDQRVKSTEVILNQVGESAIAEGDTSPSSGEHEIVVQRARSVDFGKGHVRHLSAGSAKLLDIPARRQSVDSSKKGSTASTPKRGSFQA
jgi:hypothetical protein